MEVGLGSINENVEFHMKYMGKNYKPLASLYAWRDYFINANIYGADIDKKILKNTNRIKTFHVDMFNSNSIRKMWSQINKKLIYLSMMAFIALKQTQIYLNPHLNF